MNSIAYDLHQFPFSELSYPVDGEESSPARIEVFHHRIKVISLKNIVLICSHSGDK